jgi:hypothetical protein
MSGGGVEPCAGPGATRPVSQDLYRVLLVRRGGSELLVANQCAPFTLPCVEIPKWERVAESVNAAVENRYGHSAICLFTPELPDTSTNGGEWLYQVMDTRQLSVSAPDETHWLPLDSISGQCLGDERDLVAIGNMSRQIKGFQSGETIGPFGRPGWFEELWFWVEREIGPYGLRLTGRFRQLNASPTFALIRLETSGPAVWFKAVGEPNLREFPTSIALARLFPGFVPSVMATHPVWHGWLTTEVPGRTLEEAPDPAHWKRAAETLGELQVASVGKTDQLLAFGCRDLRVACLLTLVDPFMDVMAQVVQQQRKTPPSILGSYELRTLGARLKETLSELAELGIPDTLGHLDLNPGNIMGSADQCVFLDWAEACVGPPFLTFQYLLEYFSRTTVRVLSPADLTAHYASRWAGQVSPSRVIAAQQMMPLLAVFACAVGSAWTEAVQRRDERFTGYLRSLTRRMERESGVLDAKRSRSCVGGMV